MSNLKQIGLAAQMAAADANGRLPASLDGLTNLLGSTQVLIDPPSGKPFVYAAADKNLDVLRTNEVLAYSPENKHGRAVLLADGSVEYASARRFEELTQVADYKLAQAETRALEQRPAQAPEMMIATAQDVFKSTEAAAEKKDRTPPSAAMPAAAPVATDEVQSGNQAAQTFAERTSAGAQPRFFSNAVAQKQAAVLANFQVEQNGDSLRVIDGDGSVYAGSCQIDKAVAQNVPVAAANGLEGLPPQNNSQNLNSVAGGKLLSQNYSFQVSGTNLTLKQKVVFSGNLLVLAGTMPTGQNAAANNEVETKTADLTAQQNAANSFQQITWSNARIAGTAFVAGTNRIDINAAPQ